MKVRAFETADAPAICEMLTRHSVYRRDESFWVWLNRLVPQEASVIAVAEDESGELAGHYAIVPQTVTRGDAVFRAGLGIHAFVVPDARKKVSIFEISALCYRLAKARGVDFVYGFPNADYRMIQEKLEGWRGVSLFRAWEKSAEERGDAGPGTLVPMVGDAFEICFALDQLLGNEARTAQWAVDRTARRWWTRYHMHPHKPYEMHWFQIDGETAGAAVTKIYESEGARTGHLVDWVVPEASRFRDLVTAAEGHFSGVVNAFAHWPGDSVAAGVLESCGYAPTGFETYFGIKPLAREAVDATPDLLNETCWHLPMGVSDAF